MVLQSAVFLGEDNSVKLGDFGLSKMIQSHDFASTYVGTPFYMSPEICAAEKYTLKSDIWSLGCIMFELCTREPPFNAKSHFQLVQKIKEGRVGPLPSIYSAELASVIKDCLKVNPDRRPDTAFLLNLPIIRLIRKERELLELSKSLQAREEALERKVAEVEQKMASVAVDRQQMRHEIDASLRREWEVKARLEIDRRVNAEIEQLQKRFEDEVKARVEAELQKRTVTFASSEGQELSSSTSKSDYPHSSIGGTSVDGDFPSVTDLTELSVDSPETTSSAVGALKKATRTPFGRAQTMFAVANTPMDVEMASPSPIAIASLSLSPRRNAATKAPAANPPNIFSTSNGSDKQWNAACDARLPVGESDSEEDDVVMPSPTRLIKAAATKASAKNPFTSKRPVIQSQKPTSIQPALGRLRSQPSLQVQAKSAQAVPPMSPNPDLHGAGRGGPAAAAPRERGTSPSRRLSKIPSAAALADMSGQQQQQQAMQPGQLSRKPSMTRKDLSTGSDSGPGGRANATTPTGDAGRPAGTAGAAAGTTAATAATKNVNIVRGRTLVELSQARAGGRPLPPPSQAQDALSSSPKRQPFRERVLTAAAATENRHPGEGLPPPVWDPERDEMPSPFLVRKKQPSGATKA